MAWLLMLLVATLHVLSTRAEHSCICNYDQNKTVYALPQTDAKIEGYMFEFDCKPELGVSSTTEGFVPIHFEQRLGFVYMDDGTERQQCDGDLPESDQITPPTPGPTTEEVTLPPESIWPEGTYGLVRSAQGCPYGDWSYGWREQDSEDIGTANHYSPNIRNYLTGTYDDNVRMEYCIKQLTEGNGNWPVGSYCILKKNDCPNGFTSGYIYWDDEDLFNINSKGGALPDGEFDRNTKIYYCCRDDGDVNQEIGLPKEHPFVLIRYDKTCQSVRGMEVRDIYVRWDDDDLFSTSDAGGMHPADEDNGEGHLIHFCYYATPDEIIIG